MSVIMCSIRSAKMSSKRPINSNSLAPSPSAAAGAELVPKRSRVAGHHVANVHVSEQVSHTTSDGAEEPRKPASATTRTGNAAAVHVDFDDGTPCTFHKVLGEDAHCHILSYILCLPPAPEKPRKNRSAVQHYCDDKYGHDCHDVVAEIAGRRGSKRRNSKTKLVSELYDEFFSLTKEEGGRYISIAANDQDRYVQENSEYETRLSQMFDYPRQLASRCRELLTVSKYWRRVIGKLMNLSAPKDVLHPNELATIKARVGRLDFLEVGTHFLSLCHDMWASRRFLPSDLYHDHHHQHHPDSNADAVNAGHDHKCPLEYIVRHYARGSYQNFAQLVCNEYRKFLVIKCVEVIAAAKEPCLREMDGHDWTDSSMPGQIVHLFWMAHMTSPRKYHQDCVSIAGNIIDCEHSSYRTASPNSVGRYLSKRRTLFSFEHQLSSEYFFTGPKPAFYYVENVVEVASMLRDEEAMREQRERDHDLDGDELFTDIDDE